MGEVYRAVDTKLKRAVALKRIIGAADGRYRQRLWTEAQFASRLSDPRIASVYDVFEEDGELFLVMELVEGQTLRKRLSEPLAISRFLDIGTECVEALAAAHKGGVLHRDIKPENIMLTNSGSVKILDFGVASRLPNASISSTQIDNREEKETRGFSGTLAYMAPEVLEERQADERSDIFSLGVIFYEALAGRHPFFARGFLATCNRIVNEEAPPLRNYNPRVSPELERIVNKMLAKDPAKRYVSAPDLLVDLKALRRASDGHGAAGFTVPAAEPHEATGAKATEWWKWAGIAALVACVVVAFVLLNRRGTPTGFGARDWLLVSDFENRSGEPLFDDTVTESVGRALQNSRYVNVVPRSQAVEAARLAGRTDTSHIDADLGRLICQRENYNALLAGDVERAGAGYEINFRLIDPSQGTAVWKQSMTLASPDELYKSADELAKRVRARLGESAVQIQQQSTPLARVTTASLPALQRYSAAMKKFTAGDMDGFFTLAKSSLEFDPNFPMAHLQLARAYDTLGNESESRANLAAAMQGIDRVSERERYEMQAANYSGQGLEEKALEQYRLLTELYPDDIEGMRGFAQESSYLEHTGDAIAMQRRLVKLDPHSAVDHSRLMVWLVRDGKFPDALADYSVATEHGAKSATLHWGAGLAYLGQNDAARAREQFSMLANEGGDYEKNLAALESARVLLFEGRLREASEALKHGLLLAERSHYESWVPVQRYLLIDTLQLQGKREEARAELKKLMAAGPIPESEEEELRRAGELAVALGDLPEAQQALDRLAKLDARQDSALTHNAYQNLKGLVEWANGKRAQAEESERKAAAFRPSYEVASALGRIYETNGQSGEAAKQFRNYLDFKGELLVDDSPADWVTGHVTLARSLAKAGDGTKAAAEYDEFLKLWSHADGDLPIVRQAKAERERLGKTVLSGPASGE
jgi:tetratricopeptide (TPR) repeat protein